ncbi:MAG TPA: SMI1/KNR4 family protein [Pirellulales bacterium]|nr:SMI1/KNR4 family protein [Pirellulales bacterium]
MFRFFRRHKAKRFAPSDRIERLRSKIAELAAKDKQMKTFGASTFGHGHHYRMNPILPIDELHDFEREYGVQLPRDYADFLTRVGNGGIGPYYGLCSLAESIADDPAHKSRRFLASPFPLTDFFNPYEDEQNETDDDLFDDCNICGSIVLSHQGCGYYDRLVITGPQAGQVWMDGRVSDQGITPLGCDFYTWYDRWVTDAICSL